MIDASLRACVMCEDFPCISACESGALLSDIPIKMGTAIISGQHCLPFNGTYCTVCSEQCPVPGAIEVRNGKPIVNAERCTGCGICEQACPAPYRAVMILPAERGVDVGGEDVAAEGAFDWRAAYLGKKPEG